MLSVTENFDFLATGLGAQFVDFSLADVVVGIGNPIGHTDPGWGGWGNY
jgi:hypothetical protein